MKTLNLFPAQEQNEQLVTVKNDQVVTTSLMVAEYFGKNHRDVIKSIKVVLGYAQNFAHPLFAETTYTNEQNGQSYPMYLMTRDGFTLLAMGFTPKKKYQVLYNLKSSLSLRCYINNISASQECEALGMKENITSPIIRYIYPYDMCWCSNLDYAEAFFFYQSSNCYTR